VDRWVPSSKLVLYISVTATQLKFYRISPHSHFFEDHQQTLCILTYPVNQNSAPNHPVTNSHHFSVFILILLLPPLQLLLLLLSVKPLLPSPSPPSEERAGETWEFRHSGVLLSPEKKCLKFLRYHLFFYYKFLRLSVSVC